MRNVKEKSLKKNCKFEIGLRDKFGGRSIGLCLSIYDFLADFFFAYKKLMLMNMRNSLVSKINVTGSFRIFILSMFDMRFVVDMFH